MCTDVAGWDESVKNMCTVTVLMDDFGSPPFERCIAVARFPYVMLCYDLSIDCKPTKPKQKIYYISKQVSFVWLCVFICGISPAAGTAGHGFKRHSCTCRSHQKVGMNNMHIVVQTVELRT